jgi:DNA modification methylase
VNVYSPNATTSAISKRSLQVTDIRIDTLAVDKENPRVHSKKQIRQIARSIQAFGFNVPILVDSQQRLIAGHGRLLAAKLLNLATIPAITLDGLTEDQVRAFVIADNKLTENGAWNNRLLAEQMEMLSKAELDFGIEVTGFELREIDMRIEGLTDNRPKRNRYDLIPELTNLAPVTKRGDLWILNQHRLYCDEPRTEHSYSVLMQDRHAAMVFTDFSAYLSRDQLVLPQSPTPVTPSQMSEVEVTQFLIELFTQLTRTSADGAPQFVCAHWRYTWELLSAARKKLMAFENLCVWAKANPALLCRDQHELIFVFTNDRPRDHDGQSPHSRRNSANVWRYPPAKPVTNRHVGLPLNSSPNLKPVDLLADAISSCTNPGDIVLDPLLGFGTTVVAAERTNRICYGLEVDPAYLDLIIRRWQQVTGFNAVNAVSNRSFEQIEREQANG